MYRDGGQWEEAFRAARTYGGREEAVAVALEWALSVGPEVGGKPLLRNGITDECIALACSKQLVRCTFLF